MITSKGKLTFGSAYCDNTLDDDLIISEKFTGIKKILSTPNMVFILINGNIFCSGTFLSDDGFKQINYEHEDNIEFIDMDISRGVLFALDINSIIYKIINNKIVGLNHDFGTHVTNIYGSHTDSLIFKNKFGDHYTFDTINNLSNQLLLGNAYHFYYTYQGKVLIKGDDISVKCVKDGEIFTHSESDPSISKLISALRHNIEYLHQIPDGSYLKFGADDKFGTNDKILFVPCDISNTILYTVYVRTAQFNICAATGNVYDNNFNIIPKLKNLCASAKYNRGHHTKNANNIR